MLSYVMDGKMSVRSCSKLLNEVDGISISSTTIGLMLSVCASISKALTSPVDLSKVKAALFDEIFQKKQPVLGFADPFSGLVILSDSTDRGQKSWVRFLLELKKMSLNPESTVTDGATGLLSAISSIFPKAEKIRDFFHFIRLLIRATGRIESHCYAQIAFVDLLKREGSPFTEEEIYMNRCILIYDRVYKLKNQIRKAFYIRCETGIRQYISSLELGRLLKTVSVQLNTFNKTCKEFASVRDAATYIQRGFQELTAFKRLLEIKVSKEFGSHFSHPVLEYFMKMAEYLDHFHRSYENTEEQVKWGEKIASLRKSVRKFSFICQAEVDNAINKAAEIYSQVYKSNSLIECVNSVIRVHLKTYKSIPVWFCDLFSYYWNNRKFSRGKRKGRSPMEIYSGHSVTAKWKHEILERFPYEDFRKYVSHNRESLAA